MVPQLVKLNSLGNSNVGFLSVYELAEKYIDQIKRVYWINDVPNGNIRGKHFHYNLNQLIVCLQGVLEIKLECIKGETYFFKLDEFNKALYIPKGYWREITFLDNALLLCIADDIYDENDYVRDYEKFKKINGVI